MKNDERRFTEEIKTDDGIRVNRGNGAACSKTQKWKSLENWYGTKVTLWITPHRAKLLWDYAHAHALPALPTEVLYELIESQEVVHHQPNSGVTASYAVPSSGVLGQGVVTAGSSGPGVLGHVMPGQHTPSAMVPADTISGETSHEIKEELARLREFVGDIAARQERYTEALESLVQALPKHGGNGGSGQALASRGTGAGEPISLKAWLRSLQSPSTWASLQVLQAPKVYEPATPCSLHLLPSDLLTSEQTVLVPTLFLQEGLSKAAGKSLLLLAKVQGQRFAAEIYCTQENGKHMGPLASLKI